MTRYLLLLYLMAASAFAGPLDPLFARPDLWSLNQDAFAHLMEARQYVWTSNARDSARAGGRELTLFNLPVTESVARFDNGKLTQIVATIYARGDAGELKKEEFET